jgi:ABC-type sugar transport system substrate-binding protein
MRLCHLCINAPEHAFDQALKAEAERTAAELTGEGFPIQVELRYGRGDANAQLKQLQEACRSPKGPDLFIIVPIDQDTVYSIYSETVTPGGQASCVVLHQALTRPLQLERQAQPRRLFSVAADQVEIGRLQVRQLSALLTGGGRVLYVQGRENSYGTRYRTKGLLEELARAPGIKLNGYRVFGDWTAGSVRPAVDRWAELGGRLDWIQAAGAQSDDMALALAELLRERRSSLPVIGVDGMEFGKRAVDEGVLAATVTQPLGVGHALRVFRDLASGASETGLIPDDGNILLAPESYPALEALRARATGAP